MTAVSSGPDISHGGVSGSEIWDNLFATMAYRSPGSAATSDRALERRRAASAVNNRIWEAWRWSGLVVFFLTPQWRRLRNIEIAWRLLRWWPRIDDQVRIMARQQRLSCRSATAPAGWGCFADSRLARYRLLPSGLGRLISVSLPVTSSRSAIGGLALARVFEAAAQIVIPDGIDWHVHCLSPMPFPGAPSTS